MCVRVINVFLLPTVSVKTNNTPVKPVKMASSSPDKDVPQASSAGFDITDKDNSFRQYRRLCADIADEPSYTGKTKLIQTYIEKGSSGTGFKGDVYLLMKLLLPGVVKTVYNLNNKQLVKLFSQVSNISLECRLFVCLLLTISLF